MRNYDNYTPEINYSEDTDKPAESVTAEAEAARTRQPRRRRQTRKQPQQPEKVKSVPRASFIKRVKGWLTGPSAKILAGIFLGCLTIYFAITFISYFATCINDQSKIASAPVGYASGISNPGGEGGARLSELVINEGFGLGSFVIIIWLGALSLKTLVKWPRFKTLDFTIKCLVALITVSLIIGLVTYNMHTSVNWGGYHGTYVNAFIIKFIGNIGAVLLSIFMIAAFVVICMRDLVKWILRKRAKRAERRRIAAEEKAARLAKEEEIRRMQEQEAIDDLRAGETAMMAAASNSDSRTIENPVDFEDTPLYDLNDRLDIRPDNAETDSAVIEDETDATGDGEENPAESNDSDDSSEGDHEESDTPQVDSEGEDAGEDAPNSEATEKMVVNVGSIGQSDANRFHSDVEIYESHKYKFPPFELLREGVERVSVDPQEQIENKNRIRQTLLDFGIPITSIEATVGPTVTLYEIVPDTGVKISKIRNLVDDIALSLSAIGVRIIAPIPGKGTVGIEVANKDPQTVSMRTVIKSKKYQESKYNLPVALGSTISNSVYIADLSKMPHLLVAGATGQGKSVGLNAIIASLLYCKAPHEVKFVMIDPKQVEFSLYNRLRNYYLAAIPGEEDEPVITETSKVEATLNSLVIEMENRYTLLKNAHTRNIEEYNAKIRACQLNPGEGHKFLPYIVVIVDEFGDLVMMSKSVETPIARLAQKARAVGMHVIIATQRPSTNVITGIIKANFPARISFKVSSGVDSKTILDTPGAQQLIGRGDMLILNSSEMVRVQCAFIDTPEVEKICEYIEHQPYPQGGYMLPEPVGEGSYASDTDGATLGERDPLFVEIAREVVNSGRASTSAVQRTYEVGYNRAGRIMDQLERVGIVGPSQGGKPRAVLVSPIELDDILKNIGC